MPAPASETLPTAGHRPAEAPDSLAPAAKHHSNAISARNSATVNDRG